jgi:molecular chaperone Hsp33
MVRNLGVQEVESILAERDDIDVGCDFCGQHYQFDAIDAAQLFTNSGTQAPDAIQ